MRRQAVQADENMAAKHEAQGGLRSLPLPEVLKLLESSPDGLTEAEAQRRLIQYGPNEIEEKKASPFLKFLTYFWVRFRG